MVRRIQQVSSDLGIREFLPGEEIKARTSCFGILTANWSYGQFGYCATSDLSLSGIQRAATTAQQSAERASKHSVFSFESNVRPKSKGEYLTPLELPFDSLSAGEINDILMKANDWLLNDDRIMSVSAMAMLVETTINYACSNGSDIHQKINILTDVQSSSATFVRFRPTSDKNVRAPKILIFKSFQCAAVAAAAGAL